MLRKGQEAGEGRDKGYGTVQLAYFIYICRPGLVK